MAANEIHVDDVGTVLEITLKDEGSSPEIVDVSTASTKEILLLMPNGTLLTKTADFTTDGSDGKIEYTTVKGDLAISGVWKVQAHVILGTASPINSEWRSDIGEFNCYENLS